MPSPAFAFDCLVVLLSSKSDRDMLFVLLNPEVQEIMCKGVWS